MIVETVTVIGLGYVGLPAAVVLASKGYKVIGVDIDKAKIDAINKGKCYIKEPGLDELLRDAVADGRLKATTNGADAVKEADAAIIAVPTPVKGVHVDLSYLESALNVVRQGMHKDILVVIESTVPPGTTQSFAKPLLEESGLRAEEDFYLAHVPERIAPGKAIEELINAPRVVGGIGPKSTKKAIELYSRVNPNLFPTDATTAEFVKLAENTFRDLNVAYANLLALIAEKIGIDIYEAIRLANTHPRVNIHWPGAGVGGPCLTKDPYMIIEAGKSIKGIELIGIARRINEYMPHHMVELILKALSENVGSYIGTKVAVLGVAYKGGVDDTRATPAEPIIRGLASSGVNVVVFDPYTSESFGAARAESILEAVEAADALVIVTDHPEFKQLDLDLVGKVMRHRIIVDGRRVIEPWKAREKGFKYYGIGFGKVDVY